jgi:hypothetical protein
MDSGSVFYNILDLVRTIVLVECSLIETFSKWMATNRDGVVGFNESNNTFKNDDKHGY